MKRMFAAAKEKAGDLTLYLYDEIGAGLFSDGITAKAIAGELEKAGKPNSIVMRINSPGGDVFEGLAIHNLVRSQGVPVHVMVDGLAASAASVIAMAGDRITMADNALMMIHNAWTVAIGDAAEMRKTAETLDKISGVLTDTYAKRSGQKADDVQAMMDAETWLNAKDAMDKGFATDVFEMPEDEGQKAMALAASFDLARRFARMPESLAAQPGAVGGGPEPERSEAPDFSALELDLLGVELAGVA